MFMDEDTWWSLLLLEQERDELNCEIQELKRQLEVECTKRKVERAEREVELEALQQRMREEFMALLANQSQVYTTY